MFFYNISKKMSTGDLLPIIDRMLIELSVESLKDVIRCIENIDRIEIAYMTKKNVILLRDHTIRD